MIPPESVVKIARCPEHGLHGEREECFECGGPVEQVEMIEASEYKRLLEASNDRLHLVVRLARNYVRPSLEDVERAVAAIKKDPTYRAEIIRDAGTQLRDAHQGLAGRRW